MSIDVAFENLHIGGPGPENYRKTFDAFRQITGEVIEEITTVEPLPEIDPTIGVSATISLLETRYPGVSSFILDRVVDQVKGKRRRPVYDIEMEEKTA